MEKPGEITTAGPGCHPIYTTPPLTPSPMKDSQEANNPTASSLPSLPAGTCRGGTLASNAPPFLKNELPNTVGLSYGHGCNAWTSAIADNFNGSNCTALALYQNNMPLDWSTAQLSYTLPPKTESNQESDSGHLHTPPFWLPPHASQDGSSLTPNTIYASGHFINPPPTFYSIEYPDPAPDADTDSLKRRNTVDVSCLHPRNDGTYPATGSVGQPQLNSAVFPLPPYCNEPHRGLIPSAQPKDGHTVTHSYEHTTQETQPDGAINPAPAQDFPIIPKRRRGRPPKHEVTFLRQTSNLSSTSGASSILSPATTTVSSCSSLDTTANAPDGSPGSSHWHAQVQVTAQDHGDNADSSNIPPPPNRKRSRGTKTGQPTAAEGGGGNTNLRSRNRQAAIRYRVKSQAAAAQLEAEEQEISQRRKSLLASADKLREEVYILKNEVLRHAGCDCPLIQAYLAHAAQRVYSGLRPSVTQQRPSPPSVQHGMMMGGQQQQQNGEGWGQGHNGGGPGQGEQQNEEIYLAAQAGGNTGMNTPSATITGMTGEEAQLG